MVCEGLAEFPQQRPEPLPLQAEPCIAFVWYGRGSVAMVAAGVLFVLVLTLVGRRGVGNYLAQLGRYTQVGLRSR